MEQKLQEGEAQSREMKKEEVQNQETQENNGPRPKGRWFGRGIYGSKDVPIRLLDGLIVCLIAATLILIVYFAVNGGFDVTFDTQGGSAAVSLKVRYGELLPEPEPPCKPGYDFQGWFVEDAGEEKNWDFSADKAGGDITLYARWTPAEILVKFDANGGVFEEGEETGSMQVIYGDAYGELPVPVREGSVFAGWEYSGSMIAPDTIVQMTGEHVLTAVWE